MATSSASGSSFPLLEQRVLLFEECVRGVLVRVLLLDYGFGPQNLRFQEIDVGVQIGNRVDGEVSRF